MLFAHFLHLPSFAFHCLISVPMIEGPMLEPEPVGPPTSRLGDTDCFHPLLTPVGEEGYLEQVQDVCLR